MGASVTVGRVCRDARSDGVGALVIGVTGRGRQGRAGDRAGSGVSPSDGAMVAKLAARMTKIVTWSASSRFLAGNPGQFDSTDDRRAPVESRDRWSTDPQGSEHAVAGLRKRSGSMRRSVGDRASETVGVVPAYAMLSLGNVTSTVMRTGFYLRIGVMAAALAGSASGAFALDPDARSEPDLPNVRALAPLPTRSVSAPDLAPMSASSLPPGISAKLLAPPTPPMGAQATAEDAFRAGTRLYYAGDRKAALEQLRKAAEFGHPIAQWKLGKIYQSGDGVQVNDAKAFEFYRQVVDSHSEDSRGTPQAAFVASAFVALGSYYLKGIDNTAVRPNVERARELYTYAASIFGDAEAQFNLGRLYLDPASSDRDPRQAARWLTVAAKKGHPGAQALLGQLLFSGDAELPRHSAQGLMWLTVARANARDGSEDWIRDAQEQAFSVASEQERRKGVAMAQDWIAKGGTP